MKYLGPVQSDDIAAEVLTVAYPAIVAVRDAEIERLRAQVADLREKILDFIDERDEALRKLAAVAALVDEADRMHGRVRTERLRAILPEPTDGQIMDAFGEHG